MSKKTEKYELKTIAVRRDARDKSTAGNVSPTSLLAASTAWRESQQSVTKGLARLDEIQSAIQAEITIPDFPATEFSTPVLDLCNQTTSAPLIDPGQDTEELKWKIMARQQRESNEEALAKARRDHAQRVRELVGDSRDFVYNPPGIGMDRVSPGEARARKAAAKAKHSQPKGR
jgi:hypothetical protein